MRFSNLSLAALLAVAVAALPRPKNKPQDDKSPNTQGLSSNQWKCLLPRDGNRDERRDTWRIAGVDAYLDDLLDQGVEGWSKRLFKQNRVGGNEAGTSKDCSRINGDSCNSDKECEEYLTPEAYMVAQSMSNIHFGLKEMHEKLQDEGIWSLSKGIKDIRDMFGPPPDEPDLMSNLIGLAVLGAGAGAPYMKVAGSFTGLVGVLNIANGFMQENGEKDVGDELEKTFGAMFEIYSESLDKASNAFFTGRLPDRIKDPKDFIVKMMAGGDYINNDAFNGMVDKWKKSVENSIERSLIFKAMKENGYYLRIITDSDEDSCNDQYDKKGVWMDDGCHLLVKNEKKHSGYRGALFLHGTEMSDEMFEAFTDKYKIDYKKAIKNVKECDSGGKSTRDDSSPKASPKSILDNLFKGVEDSIQEKQKEKEEKLLEWPKCFVNLDIKKCASKSNDSDAKYSCN